MKHKKGFTLVELLVVITLIGLLTIIAVPSGLTISKKIKQNMMDKKIDLIESGAIVWGQQNNSKIKNPSTACTINTINATTGITSCVKKTIKELLDENALEKDGIDESTDEKYLTNPTTNSDINDCEIEIFIKNKRVYAKYTKRVSGIERSDICYYTD